MNAFGETLWQLRPGGSHPSCSGPSMATGMAYDSVIAWSRARGPAPTIDSPVWSSARLVEPVVPLMCAKSAFPWSQAKTPTPTFSTGVDESSPA